MKVHADDPGYREQVQREAEFFANWFIMAAMDAMHTPPTQRFLNTAYTGNPEHSWLDDLIARGPYRDAAMLGCTDGAYEMRWLRARASRRLDIYELSPGVIEVSRARLTNRRFGMRWPDRRARFVCADLNFVRLPRAAYDVVWSSGCIHHLTNLEELFAEVEAALRPGGIFALQDYVGEPRLQYSADRLRAVNELFHTVPPRFWRPGVEEIGPPPPSDLSPFEAVRSDEVLALLHARFEPVHVAASGRLFPLGSFLDLHMLERDAPEILEQIFAAETAAEHTHPTILPAAVYGIFRKRGAT